jgi:hypothetical protein
VRHASQQDDAPTRAPAWVVREAEVHDARAR